MSTMTHRGVPLYRNPFFAPAANALDDMLGAAGYTASARNTIVRLAGVTGDPTASTELCDEDEADSVDAWVDALPEIPYDDPRWDADQSIPFDVEMLGCGTHPAPFALCPPELEDLDDMLDGLDAPDDGPSARFPGVMALPPIRGGSDEAEPFEPSDDDRRAAAEMFADETPEYIPTDAEWAEMYSHRDRTELPMWGYE